MNLYHVTFTNGYSQGRDRIFATSEQEAVAQSRSNHRKHGGTYRSYSATFKRKAVLDEWL